MNDNGMLVQGPGSPEVKNLLCGLLIDAFCQMNEERLPLGSVPLLPCRSRVELQRVSPSIVSEDSHNEVCGKHQGFKRIVMAHGSYATQNITNPTPPQPNLFWNLALTGNLSCPRAMNVLCPLKKVAITSSAHSRKKRKFQMVMCVDQAGKQQVVPQINFTCHEGGFGSLSHNYRFNAAITNANLSPNTVGRSDGNAPCAYAIDAGEFILAQFICLRLSSVDGVEQVNGGAAADAIEVFLLSVSLKNDSLFHSKRHFQLNGQVEVFFFA